MDKHTFLKNCKDHGLEQIAAVSIDRVQPCVRFHSIPTVDEDIQIGASKLGGDPDVPEHFVWPNWDGRNLAFLGQINLAEVAAIATLPYLPNIGILSFFYDPDQKTWGFDPNDKGSWQTYYFTDLSSLKRQDTPELHSEYGVEGYFSCRLVIEFSDSYPELSSLKDLDISPENWKAYSELYHQTLGSSPYHQLLGHPFVIQNPMELECELVSQGIYTGDGKWTGHPDRQKFEAASKRWKLLFQVDSDDNTGWMWGDCGLVYFWIQEEHLLAREFSKTWMVFQCC